MSLDRATRSTAPAGDALILHPLSAPWSLSVIPGAGGSASVDVTLSDPQSASPVWHALDSQVFEVARLYIFPAPVAAVRVNATGADAQTELMV